MGGRDEEGLRPEQIIGKVGEAIRKIEFYLSGANGLLPKYLLYKYY